MASFKRFCELVFGCIVTSNNLRSSFCPTWQFRTLAPQEHFLTLSSVSGQASVVYTYLGWSTPSYSELLLHRVPAAECPCDCDPLLLRQGLQFRRRPSAAPLRQGSVMALLLRVLLAHALSPCAASLLTFQYQS